MHLTLISLISAAFTLLASVAISVASFKPSIDQILVLYESKIIKDGTYEELIAKNGIFAELVERHRC